jgi:hypothetical protein
MTRALVPEDLARMHPGRAIVRAAIATALGGLSRSTLPEQVMRSRWSGDNESMLVLRAASSPATTTNTPALTQTTKTFLAALKPVSAGIDLLGRGITLDFNGAASITLPALTMPAIDFVGEGMPIPAVAGTSSAGPTLSPHKIGVITSLTSEMLNSGQAEELVRMVLLDACGPAVDKVLLSAGAAASDRPAGILNGITGLTPSTGTGQAALINDMRQLASAVAPVAGNSPIVIVGSPDVTSALRLWPPRPLEWPVLTSNSLAAKTIIAVAVNALVSAVEGAPVIDARREAEFQSDTAPASDGSLGTPRYSMFQKDSVALRLLWPLSWCLRVPTAVAWITNVTW